MKYIAILLFFSPAAFAESFLGLEPRFEAANPMQVVEIESGMPGVCHSESGETQTRLIRAHKRVERNEGPGVSRFVREYRFAIYDRSLLAYRARQLLLTRDWEKWDAREGLDRAITTFSFNGSPYFTYEARKEGQRVIVRIQSNIEGSVRLNEEETLVSPGQSLLFCEFGGAE